MIDAPMTELEADLDPKLEAWSEPLMRRTYQRSVRRKIVQARLDRDAGLHSKSAERIEREARAAARRDLERAVNVENEQRREDGRPLVTLAVM